MHAQHEEERLLVLIPCEPLEGRRVSLRPGSCLRVRRNRRCRDQAPGLDAPRRRRTGHRSARPRRRRLSNATSSGHETASSAASSPPQALTKPKRQPPETAALTRVCWVRFCIPMGSLGRPGPGGRACVRRTWIRLARAPQRASRPAGCLKHPACSASNAGTRSSGPRRGCAPCLATEDMPLRPWEFPASSRGGAWPGVAQPVPPGVTEERTLRLRVTEASPTPSPRFLLRAPHPRISRRLGRPIRRPDQCHRDSHLDFMAPPTDRHFHDHHDQHLRRPVHGPPRARCGVLRRIAQGHRGLRSRRRLRRRLPRDARTGRGAGLRACSRGGLPVQRRLVAEHAQPRSVEAEPRRGRSDGPATSRPSISTR